MGGGDGMHSSQRQPRQTCYPVLPTHSGFLSDSVLITLADIVTFTVGETMCDFEIGVQVCLEL